MDDLGKAKKAIQATMRHKHAKAFFNEPVDFEDLGLTDYVEVVKQPMDLGTILQRLNADDLYSDASEVKADASLIWENCRAYNSKPIDQPLRDICLEVEEHFLKCWERAGLGAHQNRPAKPLCDEDQIETKKEVEASYEVSEDEVLENFNIYQEPGAMPMRMVTDFQLTLISNPDRLVSLRTRAPHVLQGTLLGPDAISKDDAEAGPDLVRVRTEAVLDWCFQYSGTASIWAITEKSWYKLVEPSEEFSPIYQPEAEKLAICGTAVRQMQEDPDTEVSQAMDRAFAAEGCDLKPDIKLRKYVESQIWAWIQATLNEEEEANPKTVTPRRPESSAGKRGKRRLSDKEPSSNEKSPQKRRRKQLAPESPPRQSAQISPFPEGAPEPATEGVADATAKVEVQAMAKLPTAKPMSRAVLDREADARRGPPPPPKRSFRAPAALVPDIITAWELLHILGPQLQTAPFPLWRLETALHPGPHPAAKPDESQRDEQPPSASAVPHQSGSVQPADDVGVKVSEDHILLENSLQQREDKPDGATRDGDEAAPVLQSCQGLAKASDVVEPGNSKASQDLKPLAAEDDETKSSESKGSGSRGRVASREPEDKGASERARDKCKTSSGAAWEDSEEAAARGEECKAHVYEADGQGEEDMPRQRRRKRGGRGIHASTPPAAAKGTRLHLKWGAADFSQQPTEKAAVAAKESAAIDREGIASAIVLRDVHCSLLRVIEGQPLSSELAPPSVSPLTLPPEARASQAQWSQRAADAIFKAQEPVDQDIWDAAIALSNGEYWELTVYQRIALLKGLSNLALSAEPVRDLFQAKAEALQQQLAKVASSQVEQIGIPPPPGSVEEWMAWQQGVNGGMRRPLGLDYSKRRYWALGGRAACWRVYVEEPENGQWGWYEGKSLSKLVAWLRDGGIDREAALLRVLATAPLPKKFVSQPLKRPKPGRPLILPRAASVFTAGDCESVGTSVSASELASRRVDGAKNKVAPLLRGEGNWPDKGIPASFTKRIFLCVDALLGDLSFWFKGPESIARHASLLETVRQAMTAAAMGAALLKVEDELHAGGCLTPEWTSLWRSHWRQEIAACSHLQESLLHVAALQEYAVRQPGVMPRPAFERVAKECSCQLHFPFPDEELVLLKSGLLQHLRKYMQDIGLIPPDVPNAPEAAPLDGGHPTATTPKDREPEGPSSLDKQAAAAILALAEPSENAPPDGASASDFTPSEDHPAGHAAGEVLAGDNGTNNVAAELRPAGRDQSQGEAADARQDSIEAASSGVAEKDQASREASEQPQIKEASLAERMPPEQAGELRLQWEALTADVEAISSVETFTVVSIAYRRNILEGSAAQDFSREETREPEAISHPSRWPVAWLLLKPADSACKTSEGRKGPRLLMVPLRIDVALPDYFVGKEEFKQSMKLQWEVGHRFQMFFASKSKAKGRPAGFYYYGTVVAVAPRPPPDHIESEAADYDPWEAIKVAWDASRGHTAGQCEHVSPWEIERDPDDAALIEEDRAEQEADAAAQAPLPPPVQPVLFQEAPNLPQQLHNIVSVPEAAEQAWPEQDRKRQRAEDDTEWDPLLPDSPQSSGGGEWRPSKTVDKGGGRRLPVLPTAGLSTSAPQEVLDTLQPLSRDRFLMLVGNWYRVNRGKFKIPTFAHKELDLHRVFWEVQARGGSDMVTAEKMWKEICRSLGVDLSGQTSASFNIRVNYERCLLEFEHYISNGQYLADLAANNAPSPDHFQHPPPNLPKDTASSLPPQKMRDMKQAVSAQDSQQQFAPGLEPGASSTKLGAEGELGEWGMEAQQSHPYGVAVVPMDPPPPPWRRLVAPPGVKASALQPGKGWLANVCGLPPAFRAVPSLAPPVLPQLPPEPETRPQLHLDSQSSLPQDVPSPDQSYDPTPALAAALEAGYTAADLHRLVDQAAASVTRARPSLTPPKPELLGPVKDRRHGRGRQAHNKLSPLNKVGAQQLPHQRVPEGPPQDGPNQAAPSVQHPVDLKLVAEAGQAGGSTEAQQHGRQGSSVHDETASAQDQHSHHWSADPTSNVKGNSHGAGASFTELLNGEGDLPQLELQQGSEVATDQVDALDNQLQQNVIEGSSHNQSRPVSAHQGEAGAGKTKVRIKFSGMPV